MAIILWPKRFTFNHLLLSNVNLCVRLAIVLLVVFFFPSSFHFLHQQQQQQPMPKWGTGASCLCNILTESRKKNGDICFFGDIFLFELLLYSILWTMDVSSRMCNTNDSSVNIKTWRHDRDKELRVLIHIFFCVCIRPRRFLLLLLLNAPI